MGGDLDIRGEGDGAEETAEEEVDLARVGGGEPAGDICNDKAGGGEGFDEGCIPGLIAECAVLFILKGIEAGVYIFDLLIGFGEGVDF